MHTSSAHLIKVLPFLVPNVICVSRRGLVLLGLALRLLLFDSARRFGVHLPAALTTITVTITDQLFGKLCLRSHKAADRWKLRT